MSDRVKYFSGNVSGRDHIYWPRITAAQLLTFAVPVRTISCNLAGIMALSWRIREFTLSGTGSVNVHHVSNGGVAPYFDYTVALNWSIPPLIFSPMIILVPDIGNVVTPTEAAQTELDILKYADEATFPAGLQFLHNYGFMGRNYDDIDFSGTFHVELINPPDPPSVITDETYTNEPSANHATEFELFGNQPDTMSVVHDSGQFFPFASMVSNMNGGVGLGSDVGGGVDATGTDGTFTIDPVIADPLVFPMRATAQIGSNTLISLSGGFDIVATASKFWPFKNSAGQPVYGTTSGAQLTDPFG